MIRFYLLFTRPPACQGGGHRREEDAHAGTQNRRWIVGEDTAREKFVAACEQAFALWPQPCEEFDIGAATAAARVQACRPHPNGGPVVLLTGAGYNATAWYPHVALAGEGLVCGAGMPGGPSLSIMRAPLTPPASCSAWLDELPGKLSDRPAHLVGMSYGGWVTMNQAIGARASRLPRAARPRRAHGTGCPLLVVVHHQKRPGHPDPDAAAPPPASDGLLGNHGRPPRLGPEQTVVAVRKPFSPKGAARA
jgi:hypothetical protein